MSKKNILILLYLIYVVGIIGHVFSATREIMFTLTPITLLLSSLLVIIPAINNKKFFFWLALTYLITVILEIIGVKTGLVFGNYSYGETLGLRFYDVPLIIGLNWVIIIWGGILFSQRITRTPFAISTSTASLALLFDIFLEPVAIAFKYWTWTNITVPLQNYIAWFLIAFIFSYFYTSNKVHTPSSIPIHLFFIQLVFFLILNVTVVN